LFLITFTPAAIAIGLPTGWNAGGKKILIFRREAASGFARKSLLKSII
jgi:hypothetical protein